MSLHSRALLFLWAFSLFFFFSSFSLWDPNLHQLSSRVGADEAGQGGRSATHMMSLVLLVVEIMACKAGQSLIFCWPAQGPGIQPVL